MDDYEADLQFEVPEVERLPDSLQSLPVLFELDDKVFPLRLG